MGNVLGELFSDIASAIRKKTGETAKMKPTEFPDKIAAIEGETTVVDGVDPYYQQLAETMMCRNPEYLSDDSTVLNLKGFVMSDGDTLGTLASYSFAGFSNTEAMSFSDVVMIMPNAFVGNQKLRILDITASKALPIVSFYPGALDGCTALEALIIRPGEGGLEGASAPLIDGNDAFYVYVPAAYYDTVIAALPNDDIVVSAERYRKLEDYPEINFWNKTLTINYYDGDTLMHTETVKYGQSGTYNGGKSGYKFVEWSPASTNVTQDMDCYGTWVPADFADASWEEIISLANSGRFSEFYSVGDAKTDEVAYEDGTTEEITWLVADLDGTATCVDGTVVNVAMVAAHALNAKQQLNNSIASSFPSSSLNVYLNNEFFNALPTELQNGIKEVYTMNSSYSSSKCFIPAATELGLEDTETSFGAFALFATDASRVRTLGVNGEPTEYWTRTHTNSGSYSYYTTIGVEGTVHNKHATPNNEYAIVPAFFI